MLKWWRTLRGEATKRADAPGAESIDHAIRRANKILKQQGYIPTGTNYAYQHYLGERMMKGDALVTGASAGTFFKTIPALPNGNDIHLITFVTTGKFDTDNFRVVSIPAKLSDVQTKSGTFGTSTSVSLRTFLDTIGTESAWDFFAGIARNTPGIGGVDPALRPGG